MNSESKITIVKLGGSLLDWEPLCSRLNEWLQNSITGKFSLFVGGGARVNSIREKQRIAGWSDEHSHWLAIDAMNSNMRHLGVQLDGFELVDSVEELVASNQSNLLFLPTKWCRQKVKLPRDWSVTSDSLAAELSRQVAVITGQDCDLVLLKSVSAKDESGTADWFELSQLGIVDEHFPQIVSKIGRTHLVNLRSGLVMAPASRGSGR